MDVGVKIRQYFITFSYIFLVRKLRLKVAQVLGLTWPFLIEESEKRVVRVWFSGVKRRLIMEFNLASSKKTQGARYLSRAIFFALKKK